MLCHPCDSPIAVAPKNDGRCCTICSKSDETPDPVDPETTIVFGNGACHPVTGLWQALVCFYRYRIFTAKYKKIYKTQEKLAHALGLDTELFEIVQGMREELWEKCREFGPTYLTKFRMDWNAAEAKVNLYALSKLHMKVKKKRRRRDGAFR